MKRVILGMSGGVDSSVSAVLLKEAGYDVIGLFMKNWDEKDPNGVCTATDDSMDARMTAGTLGIPFYTINFEKEYWERVFQYFLREYERGRTPNPDVMCNQEIKFNAFLDYAMTLDADYIAMGHYARVRRTPEGSQLLRGLDQNKDQSYFLSRITSQALDRSLFPIGELEKAEVRHIAQQHHLINANKKDSTGICFIGERDFNAFLDQFLLTKPGEIIEVDTGRVVGKHSGLLHYTIGQRKGLGIGGGGSGEPWFVVGKHLKRNEIYVVQGELHPANYAIGLYGEDPHWISGKEPDLTKDYTAKFRYRQGDIPITIEKLEDGNHQLHFPGVKGITPGQVAVIYDEEVCLGSMIIRKSIPMEEKYEFLTDIE